MNTNNANTTNNNNSHTMNPSRNPQKPGMGQKVKGVTHVVHGIGENLRGRVMEAIESGPNKKNWGPQIDQGRLEVEQGMAMIKGEVPPATQTHGAGYSSSAGATGAGAGAGHGNVPYNPNTNTSTAPTHSAGYGPPPGFDGTGTTMPLNAALGAGAGGAGGGYPYGEHVPSSGTWEENEAYRDSPYLRTAEGTTSGSGDYQRGPEFKNSGRRELEPGPAPDRTMTGPNTGVQSNDMRKLG